MNLKQESRIHPVPRRRIWSFSWVRTEGQSFSPAPVSSAPAVAVSPIALAAPEHHVALAAPLFGGSRGGGVRFRGRDGCKPKSCDFCARLRFREDVGLPSHTAAPAHSPRAIDAAAAAAAPATAATATATAPPLPSCQQFASANFRRF